MEKKKKGKYEYKDNKLFLSTHVAEDSTSDGNMHHWIVTNCSFSFLHIDCKDLVTSN